MKNSLNRLIKGFAIVAAAVVGVSSAQAGMTPIGKVPAFEVGQEQILEHHFGGDWHKVGDDFYNGAMSAKRMDDFLSTPSVLNIAKGECGFSTDQTWCGNKFTVSAVAKFSDYSQKIGTMDENNHAMNLLDVHGYGFNIDPAAASVDMHGKQFKWTRDGDSGKQTSLDSDNLDGRDHLITYVMDGVPGAAGPVWMMFFEDLNKLSGMAKNRTVADYNDLALEVRAAPMAVPLPPAGWAGLFTLSGIAFVRGRKYLAQAITA